MLLIGVIYIIILAAVLRFYIWLCGRDTYKNIVENPTAADESIHETIKNTSCSNLMNRKFLLDYAKYLWILISKDPYKIVIAYIVLVIILQHDMICSWLIENCGEKASQISEFIIGNEGGNFATTIFFILCATIYFRYLILYIKGSFVRLVICLCLFYLVYTSDEYNWLITIFGGISYKGLLSVALGTSLMIEVIKWLDIIPSMSKRSYKERQNVKHGLSTVTKTDELQYTGREKLAEVLLEKLSYTDIAEENYAVGISSEWGTGKTTFLKHLEESAKNNFEVTNFFPWDCGGSDRIIYEFFSVLSGKLDSGNRIGKQMMAYARMLSEVAEVPYIDKLKGLLETNDSLFSLKSDSKGRIEARKKTTYNFGRRY